MMTRPHDDTGLPDKEKREGRRKHSEYNEYSGCQWFNDHEDQPALVTTLSEKLRRYARHPRHFLSQADADDAVSTTVYNAARFMTAEGLYPEAYFYTILHRTMAAMRKQAQRTIPHSPDDLNDQLADERFSQHIDGVIDWRTDRHPVARAVAKLPTSEKAIVEDWLNGIAATETAARLEITTAALYNERHRIFKRLRQVLKRIGQ